MKNETFNKFGLTFDDVLLMPNRTEIQPRETDVSTNLTNKIGLNIPLVSAAMDTVTESALAIALAHEGGIGILHKNMPSRAQAEEVNKVKRFESGIIENPVTMSPGQIVRDALEVMNRCNISGLPVTDKGKLVGILTNRDLRFVKNLDQKVEKLMTKKVITVPEGTTLEQAQVILQENRIEKLPVVDSHNQLKGLITIKDIEKRFKCPNACKDGNGRLRVGAAVGVSSDTDERVEALVKVGVDVIVIDSAHGHSKGVMDTLKRIRNRYKNIAIIAGNVATPEGTLDLIKLGADAVKIGMGPGSICTTRIIAGMGVPQLTAIYECSQIARQYKIPVIADGGIKFSGDIVKALAAGASTVMIGNLFAGTDESPGEVVFLEGRRFKVYQAMGSIAAMKRGSKDRYFQEDESAGKLVPEGVEGRVPYRGSLAGTVLQLTGGLRSGMGYCGARTISELQEKARFIRITPAGLAESHPHHVTITSEPPNYWIG